MVEIESKWLLALVMLSAGVDIEENKAELKKRWLELEKYPEWKGVALSKSQDIAQRILNKHPEWGSLRKTYR